MQHFQRRCNREERVFSNSPSKHPAQLACLCSFAPTLSTWRILSLYSVVGILRHHMLRAKKLRSGGEGLLRSARCIVPRSFVLLPSSFFLFSAHFILLSLSLSHTSFFSFPPSASKWHVSIDCSSDRFACVWPRSFSGAIHRQCWCRKPGSWRADIRETVTRGCALIDFPLEWIKSASG